MGKKFIDLTLDMHDSSTKNIGVLVQNDVDSNVLRINLMHNGSYFNLSGANTVKINIRNNHYLVETALCKIVDPEKGYIEYTLGDRAIAVRGLYRGEVEVYSDTSVATSQTMSYIIRNKLDINGDPSKDPAYPLLTQLMLDYSSAEETRKSNEIVRVENENERIYNEHSRVGEEEYRRAFLREMQGFLSSLENINRLPYYFDGGYFGEEYSGREINGGDF